MSAGNKSTKPGCAAGLVLRFIVNASAIYIASQTVPGIHLEGWKSILFVTIIFGVVNALIKPFLKLATCLIYVVTLGLFTFIVNALMFYLTAWLSRLFDLAFTIDNFLAAFLGALIVSVVSFVLSKLLNL